MEKEKVINFIGEPLYTRNDSEEDEYVWTNDGKNKKYDYAWFSYRIIFKDNKVYEIENFWAYD